MQSSSPAVPPSAITDDPERVWGRVLSIQSHTVHGYVGNKSAVFPLQLLGFDVDPINSVQFSNHTGYANGFKGQVLQGDALWDLVTGLDGNNILPQYTHLLTGYIGSASFLKTVIRTVTELRKHRPSMVYFCDPVLGDNGKLYVPKELVELYRTEVLPIATVLTPNQFECELLSGVKIVTEADAHRAIAKLHQIGVRTVILTSSSIGLPAEEASTDTSDEKDAMITLIASTNAQVAITVDTDPTATATATATAAVESTVYRVDMPRIDDHFTGTGDLIAALLLAWTTKHPDDLELALSTACATIQAVVRRTHKAKQDGRNPEGELQLIQSRNDIVCPQLSDREGISVKSKSLCVSLATDQ